MLFFFYLGYIDWNAKKIAYAARDYTNFCSKSGNKKKWNKSFPQNFCSFFMCEITNENFLCERNRRKQRIHKSFFISIQVKQVHITCRMTQKFSYLILIIKNNYFLLVLWNMKISNLQDRSTLKQNYIKRKRRSIFM